MRGRRIRPFPFDSAQSSENGSSFARTCLHVPATIERALIDKLCFWRRLTARVDPSDTGGHAGTLRLRSNSYFGYCRFRFDDGKDGSAVPDLESATGTSRSGLSRAVPEALRAQIALASCQFTRLVERMAFLDPAVRSGMSRELAIELPQRRQFRFIQVLDRHDAIACKLVRGQQLVQLDVDRQAVLVLRLLDEEYHQERHDRRAGIDDDLPGFGKVIKRSGDRPYDDGEQRE